MRQKQKQEITPATSDSKTNASSPVFNIHVHLHSPQGESQTLLSKFQPVFHLHLDDTKRKIVQTPHRLKRKRITHSTNSAKISKEFQNMKNDYNSHSSDDSFNPLLSSRQKKLCEKDEPVNCSDRLENLSGENDNYNNKDVEFHSSSNSKNIEKYESDAPSLSESHCDRTESKGKEISTCTLNSSSTYKSFKLKNAVVILKDIYSSRTNLNEEHKQFSPPKVDKLQDKCDLNSSVSDTDKTVPNISSLKGSSESITSLGKPRKKSSHSESNIGSNGNEVQGRQLRHRKVNINYSMQDRSSDDGNSSSETPKLKIFKKKSKKRRQQLRQQDNLKCESSFSEEETHSLLLKASKRSGAIYSCVYDSEQEIPKQIVIDKKIDSVLNTLNFSEIRRKLKSVKQNGNILVTSNSESPKHNGLSSVSIGSEEEIISVTPAPKSKVDKLHDVNGNNSGRKDNHVENSDSDSEVENLPNGNMGSGEITIPNVNSAENNSNINSSMHKVINNVNEEEIETDSSDSDIEPTQGLARNSLKVYGDVHKQSSGEIENAKSGRKSGADNMDVEKQRGDSQINERNGKRQNDRCSRRTGSLGDRRKRSARKKRSDGYEFFSDAESISSDTDSKKQSSAETTKEIEYKNISQNGNDPGYSSDECDQKDQSPKTKCIINETAVVVEDYEKIGEEMQMTGNDKERRNTCHDRTTSPSNCELNERSKSRKQRITPLSPESVWSSEEGTTFNDKRNEIENLMDSSSQSESEKDDESEPIPNECLSSKSSDASESKSQDVKTNGHSKELMETVTIEEEDSYDSDSSLEPPLVVVQGEEDEEEASLQEKVEGKDLKDETSADDVVIEGQEVSEAENLLPDGTNVSVEADEVESRDENLSTVDETGSESCRNETPCQQFERKAYEGIMGLKKSKKLKTKSKKPKQKFEVAYSQSSKTTKAKKMEKSKDVLETTAKPKKQYFNDDEYIPLNVSAATEFAIAKVDKLKAYKKHDATTFRERMLFGDRVRRYSSKKEQDTYKLKAKVAAKSNRS
ncbi:hypothetical protein RUM44_001096 [Polyplax serrata]|uniref:Uncharacterized protein n=1 Tax=Polyplax serrata TaxID=468196 RepID=A0ABR1B6M9_POLSC